MTMRLTGTQDPEKHQFGRSIPDSSRSVVGGIFSGLLQWSGRALALAGIVSTLLMVASISSPFAFAQGQPGNNQPLEPTVHHSGGEVNLKLPDLGSVDFMGLDGRTLLMLGLVVCAFGIIFGLVISRHLKNLPVHRSMLEVSELIFETCKTYLVQQGKFIMILEVFIAAIVAYYFGVLMGLELFRVLIILAFTLVGIAGSYGVAWFGIRINTYANSR